DVEVTGVLSTGLRDLDNILIRLNLNHVQDLMYTEDITRLVLLLDKTANTALVKAQLEQLFDEQGLALEIRTWDELAMLYHEVVAMYASIFFFIKMIVLFIVALSISNTMLMSVMERTNEIGTIRAIGATRSGVVFMVMTEAFILGVIGCLAGIAIAYVLAEVITAAHFMMPTPPGSTQTYPIRIFFESGIILETALMGLVMAVVSSIYPAVKASRLLINQALRFA
ncbi:MAG: ABC transporter permease, partial [Pseudomonadales bacterium]|nr:ABC transporter permease [Pseudomonadales bacterium]